MTVNLDKMSNTLAVLYSVQRSVCSLL